MARGAHRVVVGVQHDAARAPGRAAPLLAAAAAAGGLRLVGRLLRRRRRVLLVGAFPVAAVAAFVDHELVPGHAVGTCRWDRIVVLFAVVLIGCRRFFRWQLLRNACW